MNTSQPAAYPQSSDLRGIFDDAIRYCELRRIVYNLVLAAVVAI
jgi:hypothetical protein